MARLLEHYKKNVIPKLMKEFKYKNPLEVPRIEKIVVNVGYGEAVNDPKLIELVQKELAQITGQLPCIRRARKHVAAFKLRKGTPVGLKVTLRGKRAYEFLDRTITFALPRVRDFRGLKRNSFDGRGNYNFGIEEHIVFPEVDIDKVKAQFGMDIAIVTTAKTDYEAMRLLEELGFPFERKKEVKSGKKG